jgi:hypothetical protein
MFGGTGPQIASSAACKGKQTVHCVRLSLVGSRCAARSGLSRKEVIGLGVYQSWTTRGKTCRERRIKEVRLQASKGQHFSEVVT